MTLPLTLWTQRAFLNNALVEQIVHGIFFGLLIGLLFYNLFLLVSLREATYLYFVILLASLILEEATYEGYLGLYVTPNIYFLYRYYQPLFFSLLIALDGPVFGCFPGIKETAAKIPLDQSVILAVWGALLLLTPFTSYHVIAKSDGALGVAFPAGSIGGRDRFLEARFPPGPLLPGRLVRRHCLCCLATFGPAGDYPQHSFQRERLPPGISVDGGVTGRSPWLIASTC